MDNEEKNYALLLSIVIPVYNVQDYLADCLDSVIRQDFPSLEIICIDDCSTDDSLRILQEYANKDARIKVIALRENGGPGRARNIGVETACGTYICYLDSDDMFSEGCLKCLLPYMHDNLDMITYEISLVKFDIRPENVPNNAYRLQHDYSELGIATGRTFFSEMVTHGEFRYNVVFALYRRTWLLSNRIKFRENVRFEDGPYILSCYLRCEKMRHACVEVYIRRYRVGSFMTDEDKFTFSRLQGLLFGYEESLRLYYQTDGLNQHEQECLLQLIWNNRETVKQQIEKLPPKEFVRVYGLKKMSRLLTMSIMSSVNNRFLLDGLRYQIMEARQVYLYGAGKVGMLTISYLRFIGLENKVCGFIETDNLKCEQRHGIRLYSIKDVIPKDGTLLILSAGIRYRENMLKIAEQHGFHDIIILDLLIRELMQQVVDGRSGT